MEMSNSSPIGAASVRRALSKAWMLVRGRMGAIQWLVLCGAALVLAIALGTAYMALQYRERAIEVAERDLTNTALLLSRHFDQQLSDLQHVHQDIIGFVRAGGFDTAEAFEKQMSLLSTHEMLRTRLAAFPHVGALNVFNKDGWLINSSAMWPVPDVSVADRYYYREFTSGRATPEVIVEPAVSKVTGVWTTIFARKITDLRGNIIGIASRGVEPSHFEDFVASLALEADTTISMIHRDGTVIARYPQDKSIIGRNVSSMPQFQRALEAGGNISGRFVSQMTDDDRIGAVRSLHHFPIMIVAATKTQTALADWRAQTRLQFVAAALAVIVVIATIFLIVRQLQRQHRAAQNLLKEKSRHLDAAVNNMTQGLLLFNGEGRLVICNQRYIDMFELSPDIVKPGCHVRELVQHRKETGSFVGDVDAYCARFLDPLGDGAHDTVIGVPDGRVIRLIYKRSPDGGWVTTLEDITERRRVEARIEHLAHYDALTNLPNRTLFQRHAEGLLLQTAEVSFAILYIDIDEFKRINDSLGHLIGDEFLRGVSIRLQDAIGPQDFVARLGGDEFAVVQHGVSSEEDVNALAARIYAALRTPFDCRGHSLSADASIGIALAPQDGTELDQLIKNADLAMYGAKADGRHTYRFFEPEMDAAAKARLALEQDLRQALTNGGFEIHYQPLVDLRSDRVTGCEALVRWRHPERGMISPAAFIPVAEDTGMIVELGEWVLRTACAEAANWPAHVRLAVNVSPVQLREPTLALRIASALASSGLPANRLEIEITEAVLIGDDATALAILHELKALGVRIALDDFGTGYSSLSYLKRFPFDKIKIDRCFVTDIAEADGSSVIVQAVVNIAASCNMTTVAEGVETAQQKELLRALGCTQMQGFLFSGARPSAEVRKLLVPTSDSVAEVA